MDIDEEVGKTRREALLREISGRLKPVCAHYPDAEFALLVGKIADRQIASEARVRTIGTFGMNDRTG